ncbi:NAD(+)/NADH kinase [Enterorhabdus sp. P55]|uniref:NAD(+)/NADH kinase n=1 Tax=Enterorhabdus sp. P55 TaxID=2304571 RepID=UPI0013702F20|nr:NAD(+)/NADH kinase [Enterorhabdus sp. P55]NBI32268.1 NAD(+)/NADH kinase [Enterorhabdus sp. P55]
MFILIVRNNSNPQATDASLLLGAYLGSQGAGYLLVDSAQLGNDVLRASVRAQLPDAVDLAVVLGGDGTILQTAHLLEGADVPVLGINFGRLGFLANGSDAGVVPLVAAALAGEAAVERRAALRVDVVCDGEPDPVEAGELPDVSSSCDDACRAEAARASLDDPHGGFGVNRLGLCGVRAFYALNELAVTRGAMGRIIEFSLGISGSSVAQMRGDGVVVASATGSTAYALSAGGPLVAPGFQGLVAVPLAPHTLHTRAIVTGESDVVEVALDDRDAFREATLFADGELLLFERPVRRVYVRRSDHPVTLLRCGGGTFYDRASSVFFR